MEVVGRKQPELVMVILSREWVHTASGGEGWEGVGCWEGVSPSPLGRGLERGCAPPQVWEGGLEEVVGYPPFARCMGTKFEIRPICSQNLVNTHPPKFNAI